jgi:hypothetical protein
MLIASRCKTWTAKLNIGVFWDEALEEVRISRTTAIHELYSKVVDEG